MTKFFDDSKKWLIEAIQLIKKDKMKDKNKNLQEELESIGMINNVDKLNIEDGIRGSAQMALSTALKDSQRHRRAAKEMNDKQEAEARKALSREISNKEHPEPLDYLKPNSQIELKESLFESIEDTEDKVFQVTYKHSPEIFSSVMVKASNEDEAKEKLSAKKPGKIIVGVKVMSDDDVKDMTSRGMTLMEDVNSSDDVDDKDEEEILADESVIRYPNGMEVTDIDLDKALDYQYGTDRDKDNSEYTDDEKQKAVTYWMKKTDPNPYDVSKEKVEPLEESAEPVTEDMSDGWDEELISDIDGADVLEDIEGLIYEIRNTVRGYQSGAHTYKELGEYISDLASSLSYFAEGVSRLTESKDSDFKNTTSKEMSLMEDTTEVSYTADSEDVADKEIPADGKECIEEIPATVEEGQPSTELICNGVANELSALIKDEWEAIEGYKNTIVNLQSIGGFDEIVSVLEEIAGEEYVHVGQLQKLSELFSPQADKIADGQEEAEKQLAGESAHGEGE